MSNEDWASYPDDSDPLAPSRGCLAGLLIALPCWLALAWPVARLLAQVWK